MSDRFLEVLGIICPWLCTMFPLLTVLQCAPVTRTSANFAPPYCSPSNRTTCLTLFSSLIVANKRILSIFLVARREDLGTRCW